MRTCNLILMKYVKIDELWKIDGLCVMMNYVMLICNWLYDRD